MNEFKFSTMPYASQMYLSLRSAEPKLSLPLRLDEITYGEPYEHSANNKQQTTILSQSFFFEKNALKLE